MGRGRAAVRVPAGRSRPTKIRLPCDETLVGTFNTRNPSSVDESRWIFGDGDFDCKNARLALPYLFRFSEDSSAASPDQPGIRVRPMYQPRDAQSTRYYDPATISSSRSTLTSRRRISPYVFTNDDPLNASDPLVWKHLSQSFFRRSAAKRCKRINRRQRMSRYQCV